MLLKVIVRDNIIISGRIPSDADLRVLNGYYESFVFEIDSNMKIEEKFDYAMNMVKPYVQHMRRDSIELIAI